MSLQKDNKKLNITNPELCLEWDYEKNAGLTPDRITRSYKDKVWWKCPYCGNNWQCSPNNKSKGHGCPKCRKKV